MLSFLPGTQKYLVDVLSHVAACKIDTLFLLTKLQKQVKSVNKEKISKFINIFLVNLPKQLIVAGSIQFGSSELFQ